MLLLIWELECFKVFKQYTKNNTILHLILTKIWEFIGKYINKVVDI